MYIPYIVYVCRLNFYGVPWYSFWISKMYTTASEQQQTQSPGQISQVDALSRRKFLTCVSFGHQLALTLVELKFVLNSNWTSRRTRFFTVGLPNANSIHKDRKSTIYAWKLRLLRLAWTCEPSCEPFGHPSQVRTQVLVLQTSVDLRRLAIPSGQGFKSSRVTIVFGVESWGQD